MFDIGWPELFLIAVVVLLVVGPKELPKVLRNVGIWINKAKVVTREFRTHVDDMIHESELEEVREEINTAGQMNLEAVTENTIGLQDEIQDAAEYDDDGNYFDLDMALLEPGYMYGVKLAYYASQQWREQEEVFKFRVEDN